MAQPVPFTIGTDFSEEEANAVAGRSTVRTPALDALFDSLKATTDQILTNIALIQRDDGALLDGIVRIHTLSSEVLALMASTEWYVYGAWQTGVAFKKGAIVLQSEVLYLAMVDHTSGVFATDLAAGKWGRLPQAATAATTSFAPASGISSVNVQAAVQELVDELLYKVARPQKNGAVVDGVTDDSAAFLATSVDIGVNGEALLTPGTYRIADNVTLNGHWRIARGAVVKVDAGKTVTFAGTVEAGPYRIFDLSDGTTSKVVITGNTELRLPWWGAYESGLADLTGAAKNSAVINNVVTDHQGRTIQLGFHVVNGVIDIITRTHLKGTGKNGTGSFYLANGANKDVLRAKPATPNFRIVLEDFGIDGNNANNTLGNCIGDGGSWHNSKLENLWIYSAPEWNVSCVTGGFNAVDIDSVDAMYGFAGGIRFSGNGVHVHGGNSENNKYYDYYLTNVEGFSLDALYLEQNPSLYWSICVANVLVEDSHCGTISNGRWFNYGVNGNGIKITQRSNNIDIETNRFFGAYPQPISIDPTCYNIKRRNNWYYNNSSGVKGSIDDDREQRNRSNSAVYAPPPAYFAPAFPLPFPGFTMAAGSGAAAFNWGAGPYSDLSHADENAFYCYGTADDSSALCNVKGFVTDADMVGVLNPGANMGRLAYYTLDAVDQKVIPSPYFDPENDDDEYPDYGGLPKAFGAYIPAGTAAVTFTYRFGGGTGQAYLEAQEFRLVQGELKNGCLDNGFTAGLANLWNLTNTTGTAVASEDTAKALGYYHSDPPYGVWGTLSTRAPSCQKLVGGVGDAVTVKRRNPVNGGGAGSRVMFKIFVESGSVAVEEASAAYAPSGTAITRGIVTNVFPTRIRWLQVDFHRHKSPDYGISFKCNAANTVFYVYEVVCYDLTLSAQVPTLKVAEDFALSDPRRLPDPVANNVYLTPGSVFKTDYAGAVTINNIYPVKDWGASKKLVIFIQDPNVTWGFGNGGNLLGNAGVNLATTKNGDLLEGWWDGSKWRLTYTKCVV